MSAYRWTREELEDRLHLLEVCAFVVLAVFTGGFLALGLWLLLARGSFTGWLCICAATVLAVIALDVGAGLEEE